MATRKHSSTGTPDFSSQTVRHGTAAAIELLLSVERINRRYRFGSPAARRATATMIREYLSGSERASARRGFFRVLGDRVAGGRVTDPVAFYSAREWNGGKRGPATRDRKAHARAWLKERERQRRAACPRMLKW